MSILSKDVNRDTNTNLSRIEDSFIYIQLCRDKVKPATMKHKILQGLEAQNQIEDQFSAR